MFPLSGQARAGAQQSFCHNILGLPVEEGTNCSHLDHQTGLEPQLFWASPGQLSLLLENAQGDDFFMDLNSKHANMFTTWKPSIPRSASFRRPGVRFSCICAILQKFRERVHDCNVL